MAGPISLHRDYRRTESVGRLTFEKRGLVPRVRVRLLDANLGTAQAKSALPYSYLSASMGSRREALMAGSIPLTSPTNVRMMVAMTTMDGSMISRMSAASAFLAIAL